MKQKGFFFYEYFYLYIIYLTLISFAMGYNHMGMIIYKNIE